MMPTELTCHRCGYDLRAHPQDGKCPECGESVAESRRVSAIPRRPAWRDSDPRWRRRMVAGAWILVLLPLMEWMRYDALLGLDWASNIPMPNVFGFPGPVPLGDTFLSYGNVYQSLVFCIGVVLLFSKERGRRAGQLDWTRRWGVLCSYVVLLLSAVQVLTIAALVLIGIAALFLSMPLKSQPGVTGLFVEVGAAYLRYGPYPKEISWAVLPAFSSITILLACVPLFDALRSSGPKWVAAILLAPLALFALMHLAQFGRYGLGFSGVSLRDIDYRAVYFVPAVLVRDIAALPMYLNGSASVLDIFDVELVKWFIILTVAIWLSMAQLKAWRQCSKASTA